MTRVDRSLSMILGLSLLVACGGGLAEDRVGEVLKELRSGENGAGQQERALMMWSRGSVGAAGVAEAGEAAPEFERWRNEGGLSSFTEYEITGSRSEEGANPPAVIVTGTIDGRSFEMRVVPKRPIQWVVTPTG